MKNVEEIKRVLVRMAEILRVGGRDEWADRLDMHSRDLASDPVGTTSALVALYGGMGSINDIVIYKGVQPLIPENRELDALRSKLFNLCRGA